MQRFIRINLFLIAALMLIVFSSVQAEFITPSISIIQHGVNSADFIGAWHVVTDDIDGDGALDVIAGAHYSDKVSWFRNVDGNGTLWQETEIVTGFDGFTALAVADFDGDTDLDVVAVAENAGTVIWFENNGAPLVPTWPQHDIDTGFANPSFVVVGDIDDDGDMDVIAARTDITTKTQLELAACDPVTGEVAWWENPLINDVSSNGTWDKTSVISTGFAGTTGVAVGNLDGDSDLDIAATALYTSCSFGSFTGTVAWFENDGTPLDADWTRTNVDTALKNANFVILGNVDGVTGPDIIASATDLVTTASGTDTGELVWYANNGSGTFGSKTSIDTTGISFVGIAAADFDDDSTLDIVAAAPVAGQVYWFANTAGDGSTWNRAAVDSFSDAISVAAGQINDDNGYDVVAARGKFQDETFGEVVWWPFNTDPFLVVNTGLTLDEGDAEVITQAMLEYGDAEQDPDQVTYTLTVLPANGDVKNNGVPQPLGGSFTQADINGGLVTYEHDGGETLSDSFEFDITDNISESSISDSFAITVNPVNDAPVEAANTGLLINEGGTATITQAMLEYTDDDHTAAVLTYTVTALPAHGTLSLNGTPLNLNDTFTQANINSNLLSYADGVSADPSDSFGFSLTDGVIGSPLTGTFAITINQPPTENANTGLTVDEGAEQVTITQAMLEYTDLNPQHTAEQLTYTVTDLPDNGTLNLNGVPVILNATFLQQDINDGDVSYSHDGGETTSDSFAFSLTDGVIVTPLTGSFAITVTPVNDAPTQTANTGLTLNEGATATITSALLAYADNDHTPTQLTYQVTTLPTRGTVNLNGTPLALNGTFTQDDINTNKVAYTHDGGETTSDSFAFSLTDGAIGAPLTGTFNITVTPVNDAPTQTANTGAAVSQGQSITLTQAMLAYSDADNTAAQLIYTVTALPANGTLNLSGVPLALNGNFTQQHINNGSITYTHDGGETTSDSFAFSLTDGAIGAPLTGTFNITITAAGNTAPTQSANTGLTLNEGASAAVTQAMLAYTDGEQTAAQLTYTITALPANGTFNLNGTPLALNGTLTQQNINDGSVSYAHNGSETTSDSFGFSLSDGTNTVNSTFNITVTPVNDAPTLTANTGLTVNEGGSAIIGTSMLAYSDADNTAAQLTYTVSVLPVNGTLNLNGAPLILNGTFTQQDINNGGVIYAHDGSETTSDSFGFSLSDGTNTINSTFNIIVIPVDDVPPVVVNPGDTGLIGSLTSGEVRPTFVWLHEVDGSNNPIIPEYYNLIVVDSNGNFYLYVWLVTGDVCSATPCSYTPTYEEMPIGLLNGSYTLYVYMYLGGQYLELGAPKQFTVTVPMPAAQPGTQVRTNQGRPSLILPNDPGTTWIQVWVGTLNPVYTAHYGWYRKADAICDATTCELHLNAYLVNWTYTVYFQTWGPGGFTNNDPNFWNGPFDFTLDFPPPAAVSQMTATVTNGAPTFTWQGTAGSVFYQFWAGTLSPLQTYVYGWIPALDLDCGNAEVCVFAPENITLPGGQTYNWYIQSWGPGGLSTGGIGGAAEGWAEGPPFQP